MEIKVFDHLLCPHEPRCPHGRPHTIDIFTHHSLETASTMTC